MATLVACAVCASQNLVQAYIAIQCKLHGTQAKKLRCGMKYKSSICNAIQAERLKGQVAYTVLQSNSNTQRSYVKEVLPVCKTVATQHKRIQTTHAESTTQKEHAKSEILIKGNGMLVGVGEP